jgi:hypothetical protein
MNLGYVLADTGDTIEATKELEEALRLDPTASGARDALTTLRGQSPR